MSPGEHYLLRQERRRMAWLIVALVLAILWLAAT